MRSVPSPKELAGNAGEQTNLSFDLVEPDYSVFFLDSWINRNDFQPIIGQKKEISSGIRFCQT
jgi:hypothetical protein